MEQTVPLETAAQHYVDAARRGEDAGRIKEQQRIYQVLKAHGQYEALFILKSHQKKER